LLRGGQGSGTRDVSRERFSASSLPGLTRQSIQGAGLLMPVATFASVHVRMDRRVKPGGDDGGVTIVHAL
jgi:hypothetical protein